MTSHHEKHTRAAVLALVAVMIVNGDGSGGYTRAACTRVKKGGKEGSCEGSQGEALEPHTELVSLTSKVVAI